MVNGVESSFLQPAKGRRSVYGVESFLAEFAERARLLDVVKRLVAEPFKRRGAGNCVEVAPVETIEWLLQSAER